MSGNGTQERKNNMANIISVGPEVLGEYDIRSLDGAIPSELNLGTIIYYYKTFCYSGSGVIVYKDSNGDCHKSDIEHCSCFGPLEGAWNPLTYTKEQVIDLLGDSEAEVAVRNYLKEDANE